MTITFISSKRNIYLNVDTLYQLMEIYKLYWEQLKNLYTKEVYRKEKYFNNLETKI